VRKSLIVSIKQVDLLCMVLQISHLNFPSFFFFFYVPPATS